MNFDKIKPYAVWIVRAAILIVLVVMAYSWNEANKAKEALSKQVEAERLRNSDLIVEIEKSKRDMEKDKNQLLGSNSVLREEVERLTKALGEKPKIIEVEKLVTKETIIKVPVDGTRPCDAQTQCVMAVGDSAIIKVEKLTFKTDAGNTVVVGTAEAVRTKPGPVTSLFISPFESPAPTASALASPPPLRWGAGVIGAIAKDGWALGPKLMFPPVRVWNLQGEGELGVAIGPTGTYVGQAGFGVRW